ncbi:metallophosphoesterase [Levilactobacillus sp. HBUAS70063]|uniref:metallophosphoesterase n=1 Tax=Levilactobacillus sp. HBUAS70063 TaxID=3109359 RepID=UPI0031331CBF
MAIYIALDDLHGKLETLDQLAKVQAKYRSATTVFIGDYIDTSTDNLGFALIDRIRHMQAANPAHTVVLMGNHEQAALDFFRNSYRDA